MQEEDTEAKQNHADGREGPQNQVCGVRCRNQPTDQRDLCHDHYPQPEPEIDKLLLDAIEFRHEGEDTSKPDAAPSVIAPSNAMHKALAKRVAICQSSAQCARTLMHLLGSDYWPRCTASMLCPCG